MKRYLPTILLSLILLFALASVAQGIETIVKDYPALKACKDPAVACKPGDEGFGLPEFIKYIYIFSIGAVGLIGMVAIVIAAFDYTMSAGNPQKAAAGKDKLLSALLGILLLLGSVVLLNLINPDLLKLRLQADEVVVDVTTDDETEEGCRFLQASWDKRIINAEESATLTLTLDFEKCEGTTFQADLFIKQDLPGGPDRTSITINAGMLTRKSDSEFSYTYTFGVNACRGDENKLCNFIEEGDEIFYAQGRIKVTDQPMQYVPKLSITVRDGR